MPDASTVLFTVTTSVFGVSMANSSVFPVATASPGAQAYEIHDQDHRIGRRNARVLDVGRQIAGRHGGTLTLHLAVDMPRTFRSSPSDNYINQYRNVGADPQSIALE